MLFRSVIFTEHKRPQGAVVWTLILTLLPIAGIFLYLFFGNGFNIYKKRKRVNESPFYDYLSINKKDILSENTVALTIMSNMGVKKALGSQGIDVSITPVGDKYVYQRMSEQGYQLGGEKSGHVIMKPYSVTGECQRI